jgi:hypothetical protein
MTTRLTDAGKVGSMSQDKLATRIFLILHDPFTGKPLLRSSAVRLAVAGAELAELTLEHLIGMENDRIVLAEDQPRRIDYISSFVIDGIRAQSDAHTAVVWVSALADRLFDLVATQLVNEGVVRCEHGGGLFRRGVRRYPADDLLAAARPRVRLEHKVRTPTEMDQESAVALAVFAVVGGEHALEGNRAAIRQLVAAHTEALPLDLRGLVTGIEVAHASGELPASLRLRASDK